MLQLLLVFLPVLVGFLLVGALVWIRRGSQNQNEFQIFQPEVEVGGGGEGERIQRAQGQVNQRRAVVGENVEQQGNNENERVNENGNENEDAVEEEVGSSQGPKFKKIGKKKAEKLERKEEKRKYREYLEAKRAEEKKQEEERREIEMEKRMIEMERERRERIREQKEKLEKERIEKEKQEAETREFEKIKKSFVLEEEGDQASALTPKEILQNKLPELLKHQNVIDIAGIAAECNLKLSDALSGLQQLISSKEITGIFDDRGVFIFIPKESLEAIAQSLKNKGRMTKTQLTQICNLVLSETQLQT